MRRNPMSRALIALGGVLLIAGGLLAIFSNH
jgi:catechol 2,3-dioxygenase-like lactoylglutathione lyase family enzyme